MDRCPGFGYATTEIDEAKEERKVVMALLFRSERSVERAAAEYDQIAEFLEAEGVEADRRLVAGVGVWGLE